MSHEQPDDFWSIVSGVGRSGQIGRAGMANFVGESLELTTSQIPRVRKVALGFESAVSNNPCLSPAADRLLQIRPYGIREDTLVGLMIILHPSSLVLVQS